MALRTAPLRSASARAVAAPRRAAGFRCSAAAHAYTAAPMGTNPSLVRLSAPPRNASRPLPVHPALPCYRLRRCACAVRMAVRIAAR
jgi:hypothetical protein